MRHRAFAFETASKVDVEFCQHNCAPEPLASMGPTQKNKAAADHPCLWGLYHVPVIHAVKARDIEAKWASTSNFFISASHACHMYTRSHNCSLCKNKKCRASAAPLASGISKTTA